MYVVWKVIPLEVIQKIDEAHPNSISQISIGIFGGHFGYLPVFLTYKEASTAFPHCTIIQLPLQEVILTNENTISSTNE